MLNPDLPEIYSSECFLKFHYEWEWKGAVESYKKASELDRKCYYLYSILRHIDRCRQKQGGLPLADKAAELDPVSIASLHNLVWTNLLANNFQKSDDAFQKALDLHPNWVWGYIKQAYAYIFMHQYDKALANAAKAVELFNYLKTDGALNYYK